MLATRKNFLSIAVITAALLLLLADLCARIVNAEENIDILHEFHHELLETEDPKSFDHLDTGFPLIGNHANLPCEQCHQSGVYERLPRRCGYCHNNELAVGKPINHLETNSPCDICHTIASFIAEVVINHGNFEERCISCHVGGRQTAKSESHIISSDECDACHNKHSWIPVTRVDHTQLIVGSCVFCHNGIYAQGKDSSNHMPTTDACEACHAAALVSWAIKFMDHAQSNSVCASCHNRIVASGPNDGHLGTLVNCDACHNVVDWSVIFYDHNVMRGKRCASCHDGIMTDGKPNDHLASSNLCERCHNMGFNWQIDNNVDHNEVTGLCHSCHKLPHDHKAVARNCAECHVSTNWNILNKPPENN